MTVIARIAVILILISTFLLPMQKVGDLGSGIMAFVLIGYAGLCFFPLRVFSNLANGLSRKLLFSVLLLLPIYCLFPVLSYFGLVPKEPLFVFIIPNLVFSLQISVLGIALLVTKRINDRRSMPYAIVAIIFGLSCLPFETYGIAGSPIESLILPYIFLRWVFWLAMLVLLFRKKDKTAVPKTRESDREPIEQKSSAE